MCRSPLRKNKPDTHSYAWSSQMHDVRTCQWSTFSRRVPLSPGTYADQMFGNPDISYLATTNGRNPHRTFGIKQADRLFHTYVIGKTGTGKTTLLETIALQDMMHGRGVTVMD